MDLSPNDAFALRRALVRLPVPEDITISDPVRLLLTLPQEQLDRLLTSNADLAAALLKIDPDKPPTTPASAEKPIYVPPLPDEAQLSKEAAGAAESVGGWYRGSVAWCCQRTPMTPPHFIEAGVIWLICLMIARRLHVTLHEDIYPNIYLLIVAETSRYAKSTAMNLIYRIAYEVAPHMLIPGSATSEGMIEMLAGISPANYDKLPPQDKTRIDTGKRYAGQRGIILDEFSSLLGSSRKDYMQGFAELLMKVFDPKDVEQHYTKSGGLYTIYSPGLNIFGATTPAGMGRSVTREAWESGEMARYWLLYRDGLQPYTNTYAPAQLDKALVDRLRELHSWLPAPPNDFDSDRRVISLPMSIDKDALEAYNTYSKALRYDINTDIRLVGNYTRLPILALKIAIALAAVEDKNRHIQLGHWAMAQQLAERARENIHRLIVAVSQTRDARTQSDLLNILNNYRSGMTVRDLCRSQNSSAAEIRAALDVLIEAGAVKEVEHRPPTGRPTKIYIVSDRKDT